MPSPLASPPEEDNAPPPLPRLCLSSSVICLLTCFFFLTDALPMTTWFLFAPSHPHCCWTIAAQHCNISIKSNGTSPFSSLEALAGESLQTKEKIEKVYFYAQKNKSDRDFQRGQIWNDCSQKPKTNYGRHPVPVVTDSIHVPPPSLINWHEIVGVLHPSRRCVFSDTHHKNNFRAPTRDAHCTDVEDHFEDGSRPISEFQDPALEFHGLTAIQYQGGMIQWLQREYGDHVQVHCTLYKDYRNAENQGRQTYPNTEPVSPNYSSYTRL